VITTLEAIDYQGAYIALDLDDEFDIQRLDAT
jgi:hypothetical protein